jgi:hypothetical protein
VEKMIKKKKIKTCFLTSIREVLQSLWTC